MEESDRNIWKLYIYNFLRSSYFFSGVLVPFYTDWGGISFFQIMVIQAWYVLWVTFLEVPTGAVADFLGRKTSIILGVLANIIAVIAYSTYPSFYLFLIAEAFWALAFTLISGADVALVYDTLKDEGKEKDSKKVLGRYNSAQLMGFVVAAPVGSLIAAAFGLQYAVRFMAIPFLIAAIVALTIKEPRYRKEKVSEKYIRVLTEGIRYFKNHKILKILAFDAISVSVLSFFIIWTYQPMLLNLGYPLALLGIVSSVGGIIQIIISNNFSMFEKLTGSKKNFMVYSALLIGASFMLFSLSVNKIFTFILIVIIMGFGFTRRVLFDNYMNKFIESKNRATVLSAISMTENLVRGVLYVAVGLAITYSMPLTLFVMGIAIIGLSLFSKVEEKLLID